MREARHIELAARFKFSQHHRAADRIDQAHGVHIQEAHLHTGGRTHGQSVGHQGFRTDAVAQHACSVALQNQTLGRVQHHVVAGLPARLYAVLQGDVVDRIKPDLARHTQRVTGVARGIGHHNGAGKHRQVIPDQRRGQAAYAHLARTSHRVACRQVAHHNA